MPRKLEYVAGDFGEQVELDPFDQDVETPVLFEDEQSVMVPTILAEQAAPARWWRRRLGGAHFVQNLRADLYGVFEQLDLGAV